ncbi:uncharacterized protein F5147DRAFT_661788 [Suillus discolor]|uniref:Uncharacterized protein n=1 Tax=Suillus discolor TaxID=1912936 RepID=A0A9P7EQJ8_9AGAM|nr:uncharacterized protein F5147DRAFT_661788 [Suillus discolor]KAG2079585.1 hypothetical protein F5147DRAFT_661788 [Suillus discolor]
MPPMTRGQASKLVVTKRRTAQMMREQRMSDRLKTLHADAPFRGTRSGRNGMQMLPVGVIDARQPEINDQPRPNMTDLNAQDIAVDVRLEQASNFKIEPAEEKIGANVKTEFIDETMEEKMGAIVKIEPSEDDRALLIVKIEEGMAVIVKIEPTEDM